MTGRPNGPALYASDLLAELGAHVASVLRKPAVAHLREGLLFSNGADAILLELGGLRVLAQAHEEGDLAQPGERSVEGAHAATSDPVGSGVVEGSVRVFRIDPETARRFHEAMSAPAPAATVPAPAVLLDAAARSVLRQLWPGGVIEDGDLVSKDGRSALLHAGLAVRGSDGLTSITDAGRALGRELGWLEPSEFARARTALAAQGRAHDAQVHRGPNNAPARADGTTPDAACSKGAPSTSTLPAVAPLDFPLTIEEEAARLAAVAGPCDGASFLVLGRALSSRMGQPMSERTTRAVARVREALELAHGRASRGGAL